MPAINTLPSAPAHFSPSPSRSLTALAGWLLLNYSASATVAFIADNG